MQLKHFTVVTSVLAALLVHAQVNVTDIISDITDIAVLAGEVVGLVQGLDITTILTSAPKIIDNIGQIVEIITTDVEEISAGNSTFKATDQTDICDGLQQFLEAVGQIADTVTDNIDAISDIPFSGAVADVISSVKDGVDEFGGKILEMVPDCGSDTENSLESVNKSFSNCIDRLD
ncbi:hypothetical protein AK830_g8082 [Neonectria ditissima]|uniref:Uncharacterized protein n=1 Tax=Neonectria ditissima TaxID=78410 RepID=A0A0P7AVD3_9HYPO|nr:hypothetical protein AK830_g8082 [Neonectria ditissima]